MASRIALLLWYHLTRRLREVELAPGDRVEPDARHVYVVTRGTAQLLRRGPGGHDILLRIVGPGGIVPTLIFSPRILWRSASAIAPSATWPTWAPPPMTMMRLPKTSSMLGTRSTLLTTSSDSMSRMSSSSSSTPYSSQKMALRSLRSRMSTEWM